MMKILCTLLVTLVAFLSGCQTLPTPDPEVEVSSTRLEEANIEVISATYGSGVKFADVTDRSVALLNQQDEFFARPEWLKVDPTPGWNKAYVMIYAHHGERKIFSAGEGGRVSTPRLTGAE